MSARRGQQLRFQPSLSGSGLELPTGLEVPVVYLADKPRSAHVDTRRHILGSVWFWLFFGVTQAGTAVHLLAVN